jgi:hypothetical protein
MHARAGRNMVAGAIIMRQFLAPPEQKARKKPDLQHFSQ